MNTNSVSADSAVAALYFAGGLGLFFGMMVARRVGVHFELKGTTVGFIGWSLVLQGVLFAFIGVAPGLWIAGGLLVVSRVLLGAEFAVQETLLMRLVPDHLRGRVSTTDRASELLIWSLSTAVAGWSLQAISPRTLTIASGLFSSLAGVGWLILFALRWVTLPRQQDRQL
jgi:MFS family permease